jgi:hypothetical protein
MTQHVFDDAQLTAMTRAVSQIMDEMRALQRDEVAHAVFTLASETGEFDAAVLAKLALESMAPLHGAPKLKMPERPSRTAPACAPRPGLGSPELAA